MKVDANGRWSRDTPTEVASVGSTPGLWNPDALVDDRAQAPWRG